MKSSLIRFGELYEIPSSNGLSRPRAVRGAGYKMINMGELFANNIISDIEMERVLMSDKELAKFLVKEDDLLFARQSLVASGAGKCSIIKDLAEPTTFESHLIRVRLDKNRVNPWFYYYVFRLQNNPIKTIVNQCAQAGIRGNELVRVKVPYVEKEIQDRIASILKEYDLAIENNNKRIKILEQMAENLYREWFVRFRFPGHENVAFKNGIPETWKIKRLFEIADIVMGQSPESEYYNDNGEGLPFHQGVGSYGDFYLVDGTYSTKGKKTANPYSIIFSVRAPVGRININLNRIILGRGVASINSKSGRNGYLLWMLKYMFLKEDIIGNGSVFTSVTKDELYKQKVLMPSDSLIGRFDHIASDIEKQIRNLYLTNCNLTRQRDLLLPRLMSGRLQVK